jgi:DNA-directed RNA polymerase subunit RPC12/RpoP
MTERVVYQCRQCGNRFEAQVLNERETREAKKDNRPVYAVQCPHCGSRDIRRV